MRSRLLNTLIIAIFLLSIAAPLVPIMTTPIAKIAKAQAAPTIWANATKVTCNTTVKVVVTVPGATASTVKVNVTVNGALNTVTLERNGTTDQYVGYLYIKPIQPQCGAAEVIYISLGGYTSYALSGTLNSNGQTIVISMKGAENTWTIYFYNKAKLVIEGREYPPNSGVYWIPRICNCTIGSINPYYAYNPWEWYIIAPFATPGKQYNVSINITNIVNDEPVASITAVFNATTKGGITVLIPANKTEAMKINYLLLEASNKTTPWYIMGNNFNDIISQGDLLQATATIYNATSSSKPITTKSIQLRIFVSIAKIYIEPATLSLNNPEFTVYVADADANFNSTYAETYPFNLTIGGIQVTLKETGPDTGLFAAQLNLLTTKGLYPQGFNETNNKLYWSLTEIRIDKPGKVVTCLRSGYFTIQYHKGIIKTAQASVILRQAGLCCPVLELTLETNDTDLLLGYPSTVPVAVTMITSSTPLINVTANYTEYYSSTNTIEQTKVPALMISLYLVGVNETNGTKAIPLTATANFTLAFYQTSSNTITAQIPLSLINWAQANKNLTKSGYNPKCIEVVYYDLFNPSLQVQKHIACVKVQHVSMSLDRYVLPVVARTLNATNYYTNISGSPYQVVHIKIYDEGMNKNCCQVDNISASSIELILTKYDKAIGKIVLNKTGYGEIRLPLKERLSNGSIIPVGECYMKVTNLTETGPNTGNFTGELRIYSIVHIGGKTYWFPGCPSPWLNDATLTLKYISGAVGYAEKTIKFKVEDATLKVSSTNVYFGKNLTIIVNDPDANLDNSVNETIPVIIEAYCPVSGELKQYIVPLKSVAANSSVFEATIPVTKPYVPGPCTQLIISYRDPTPYDSMSLSLAQQLLEQAYAENGSAPVTWLLYYSSPYAPSSSSATSFASSSDAVHEVTVNVEPMKGKVEVFYELQPFIKNWVNVTNKVIPALNYTQINITVIDSDQNKNAMEIDTIPASDISITFNGTTKYLPSQYVLIETGPDTGVFTTTLSLSDILSLFGLNSPLDLAGKTITITYHDPSASCQTGVCGGTGTATSSVTLKVVDVTGRLTVVNAVTGKPQNSFNCYCMKTHKPGNIITISVADLDLLPYSGLSQVNLSKFISIYNVRGMSMSPAANNITFRYAGTYNVTIDGVPIPVAVFNATNIQLLCSSFETTSVSGNYIVAPPFTTLKIVYHDPAGSNGMPVNVAKSFSIGIATITKPEETASINASKTTVVVYRNGTFVQTTLVVQGEPVTIEAPITYSPLAASMFAGKTFDVVYLITDNSGHVYAFGYVPVSVSQSGYVVVPLQISSLVTKSLAPGTYKVVIYAVNNLVNLVSLSKPIEITITVQAA